jgi:hypothetical protein
MKFQIMARDIPSRKVPMPPSVVGRNANEDVVLPAIDISLMDFT